MSTLERDWKRIGVKFKNAQEERLDIHALRHTFRTNLDRAKCSRITIKKLMRQAPQDVTDGYGHAELWEMFKAIKRLPAPESDVKASLKTGFHDQRDSKRADHRLDHGAVVQRHSSASIVTLLGANVADPLKMPTCGITLLSSAKDAKRHPPASTDLIETGATDTVEEVRPSTQVD